jgi:hypothetical protein
LLASQALAVDPLFKPHIDYPVGNYPVYVCTADFNLDGHPDLAVAEAGSKSNTVTVLINKGDGTFGAGVDYTVGTEPLSVCAADFDGDGAPDLAAANFVDNNVSILKNNGDGTFSSAVNYGVGSGPYCICAADFDGDGKPDLAVANCYSNTVSVLKNNGDGTFAQPVYYQTGVNPLPICAADLDGDGKPDLAVGNFGSSDVLILKNNGDGTFSAAGNYGVGNNPFSICSADFDGDGKPDLAVANQTSHNVSILKNNGDGTFVTAVNYEVGSYPVSVCSADFDFDGKPDLGVACEYSDSVSILLNNGGGIFATAVNYEVGSGPESVGAADFNGDLEPDLAVANASSENVSILMSNGPIPSTPRGLSGTPIYYNNNVIALLLTWNHSVEPNLSHYDIYRDIGEGLTPGPSDLIASRADTFFYDAQWRWNPSICYKVSAVDSGGKRSGFALLRTDDLTGVESSEAPKATYLSQNYPNPFNPTTRIEFGLRESARVSLRIYDAAGRLVRVVSEGQLSPGRYARMWDGKDTRGVSIASGIYLYRLDAGSFTKTKKMVLLR